MEYDAKKEREIMIEIYTEIIHCINSAISALSKTKIKGIEECHNYLIRVKDIITILIESIEPNYGTIGENLNRLYWYSYLKIVEGNLRKDTSLMKEVKNIFLELIEGYSRPITENPREKSKKTSMAAYMVT